MSTLVLHLKAAESFLETLKNTAVWKYKKIHVYKMSKVQIFSGIGEDLD